jgi:hypothetical protein
MPTNRREWMLKAAALAASLAAIRTGFAAALPEAVVYKSPYCGCCGDWVAHLQANGFTVKSIETVNLDPVRERYRVPAKLASCHTALIGGYVVEGHVPASAVKRLLKEKPPAVGISVPGMPIGSPGMEGPNPEAFNVMVFDERGQAKVFESYRPPYRW